jgi:formate/nitrite transporter FocA (FNT family)
MELFTGDAMLGPLANLQGKIGWGKILNNWVWVWIGNFIGSLAYAYIMVNGPFTQGAFAAAEPNAFGLNAVSIAVSKTLAYKVNGGIGLWSCFLAAIGCNFLVNVAIMLVITAKEFIGKFFGIWFPIMAFVATGFEHCVANMYFLNRRRLGFNYHAVSCFRYARSYQRPGTFYLYHADAATPITRVGRVMTERGDEATGPVWLLVSGPAASLPAATGL